MLILFLCAQLYIILFGDKSVDDAPERRIRVRRDADVLPEPGDQLLKHLSEIPDLTGSETSSFLDRLTGTSTSLVDHLFTAGRIPATDGMIFRLLRDNPKLLLNPEILRFVIELMMAIGRHQVDSFLETYHWEEMIVLLKVNGVVMRCFQVFL